MSVSATRSIKVWDLPTRLFHIGLILCITACFITIKAGGLWMDWHVRFGMATLGLMIFRVLWGFIGGDYSRFKHFPPSVTRSWNYLRHRTPSGPGHNPLGAWSVYAMLLLISFQAVSGLFANDDIFTTGPLAYLSADWSKQLTGLHKSNEWPILLIIALHILAILSYRLFAGQKLTSSMVHGHLDWPQDQVTPSVKDTWKTRLLALFLALLIAAAVYSLTFLAPASSFDDFM